jgi:hypothetical protein
MSAQDLYHDQVVRAQQKDGWTITNDPLTIPYGKTEVPIDLGVERLLAAERDGRHISVEIKSFINPSPIQDLKEAIGQFALYTDALGDFLDEADRTLYLAIRLETYNDVFLDATGQRLIQRGRVRLIVFDAAEEVILLWTS